MIKNKASQVITFQAISTTDGSDITTGSPTIYITIDGGTQNVGSGASVHEGNGCWSYVPTQAETNGDHIAFTFTLSGAITQTLNAYPTPDLFDMKTDVDAILLDTGTDGVLLASTATTQLVNDILAGGDIDGYSLEESLKICAAVLAGKVSGAGTNTVTFRAADDSKDRIVATVTGDGNRLSVTIDTTG